MPFLESRRAYLFLLFCSEKNFVKILFILQNASGNFKKKEYYKGI